MSEAYVADTPIAIRYVQLCALKGAVKLESKGMKRKGRSARAIAVERYNLPKRSTFDEVIERLQFEVDLILGGMRTAQEINREMERGS